MSISLITFGGLASAAGSEELDWLSSQWLRAAILVYLTLERVCTRDALLAVFWPDSDGDSAGHRLSQAVYALRRAIGEDCIETKGRELRAGARLEADALEFERAIEAERYDEAIALYRGPFLAGVHLAETNAFQTWVDARRTRYARQFRKASRTVVDARMAAGDPAGAVAVAQAWVAADPLDDEAQHRLIELLAHVGGRTEALRQYESYTRFLEAEELEPLDQTRELVRALERETGTVIARTDREATVTAAVEKGLTQPDIAFETAAPAPVLPGGTVEQTTRRSRWQFAKYGIGLAILLLFVWAIWPQAEPLADPASATPGPPAERGAVLFFHDDSRDQQLDWFAWGLSHELSNALGDVHTLDLISMNGVRPYRDGLTLPAAVARNIDAYWLVGGSVNHIGSRLVTNVELIEGATGRRIAGKKIERPVAEAFPLIADVVDEVADFIRKEIGIEVRTQRWRAGTNSVAAFRLVQLASKEVDDAFKLAETDQVGAWKVLRRADSLLVDAARADRAWPEPLIQRAWAARRTALLVYFNRLAPDSVPQILRRGVLLADSASIMRPGDPAAIEARGVLHFESWRLAPADDTVDGNRMLRHAEADLRRAVNSGGNHPRGFDVLSWIHHSRGETATARSLAEKAFEADAYLEGIEQILIRLFNITFESGDDPAARQWCLLLGRRFPDTWSAADCRLMLMAWAEESPNVQEAWRIANRALNAMPPVLRPSLGPPLRIQVAGVLASASDTLSAEQVLRAAMGDGRLVNDPASRLELLQLEAGVRLLLNQPDSAEKLLDEYFRHYPDTRTRLARSRRFNALLSAEPDGSRLERR